MKSILRVSVLGLMAAAAVSCASNDDPTDRFAYVEQPVEILYAEGAELLERKRYEDAIAYFTEVERQHPYSAWARRAMLMTAYAEYLTRDFDASLQSIDRFLAIHPGNKDAAYAFYLRAMNYYERIRDVGRDQKMTRQAAAALTDVVRRYPDSDYARDAQLKLDLTRDHLAGKEMDVGRYYLRRNQHVAAIGRFNNVLEQYQTTGHTEEALHRIVEAYLELGLVSEAERHAAILGYNYPDSPWYEDTYRLFRRHGEQLRRIQLANDAAEAEQGDSAEDELTPEERLAETRAVDLEAVGPLTNPSAGPDVNPDVPGAPVEQ